MDDVIRNYSSSIADWAYLVERPEEANLWPRAKISDLARISNNTLYVQSVSPSSMLDNSLAIDQLSDTETSLSLTE